MKKVFTIAILFNLFIILSGQNRSTITVTGLPLQGQELTAGDVIDPNGNVVTENVTYKWQQFSIVSSEYTDIPNATRRTFTLTQEGNEYIRVVASYTGGNFAQSSPIGPIGSTPATGSITISNDSSGSILDSSNPPTQGQTLTATATLSNGNTVDNVIYEWISVDENRGTSISRGTSNTYTLTDAEIGKRIIVSATYTDNFASFLLNSSATVPVISDTIITFSGDTSIKEDDTLPISGNYFLGLNPNPDNDPIDSLATVGGELVVDSSIFIGTYGTLTLSSTSYIYVLTGDDIFSDFVEGQTEEDIFEFVTTGGASFPLTITIMDVNTAPNDLIFSAGAQGTEFTDNDTGATLTIDENVTGMIATVMSIDDSDSSSFIYSFTVAEGSGASADDFIIDENSGALSIDSGLDFEAITDDMGVITVRVNVNDFANDYFEDITITVTDVNEAPTAITFDRDQGYIIDDLSGEPSPSQNTVVATVTIEDDASGINTITTTPSSFEVNRIGESNQYDLVFLGGISIPINNVLMVTVEVVDSGIDNSTSIISEPFSVNFTDAVITFNGDTSITEGDIPISGNYYLNNGENGSTLSRVNGETIDENLESITGTYGTLTISNTGYIYDLNNNNLAEDAILEDTFNFFTSGGSSFSLTITINGVNTAPTNLTFGVPASQSINNNDSTGATLNVNENVTGVIATVTTTADGDSSSFTYSFSVLLGSGASRDDFSINTATGALSTTGTGLDFEAITDDIIVTINVNDGDNDYAEDVVITVRNVDDPSTAITLDESTGYIMNTLIQSIPTGGELVATFTVEDQDTVNSTPTIALSSSPSPSPSPFETRPITGESKQWGLYFIPTSGVTYAVTNKFTVNITINPGGSLAPIVEIFTLEITDEIITFSGDTSITYGDTSEISGSFDLGSSSNLSILSRVSTTEGGTGISIAENGADTEITGTYGTLTLNSIGYSYVLTSDDIFPTFVEEQTEEDTFYFVTTGGVSFPLTITIMDVNTAPNNLIFSAGAQATELTDNDDDTGASLNVNENVTGVIATVTTTDVDTPTLTPTLTSSFTYSITEVAGSGASADDFSIDSTGALSTSGFNFEAISGDITVRINVNDGDNDYAENVVITVNDADEEPTAISLDRTEGYIIGETILQEDRIVATITIEDDALGTNQVIVTSSNTSSNTLTEPFVARPIIGERNKYKLVFLKESDIQANQFTVTIAIAGTRSIADFTLTIIDNPATVILNAMDSNDIRLSDSVVDAVESLGESVSDSGLNDNDRTALTTFINQFSDLSANPKAQQVLVNELIPETHTSVTPVLEDIVDNLVANLSSRSLSQVDNGSVNVNGPNSQQSSSSVKRGSFWYDFSYIGGSRDGKSGYDYNGYAIRGGYERLYGEVFVGATLSYNGTSVDNGSESSGDFNSISGGVYGNYQKGNSFFTGSFILAFSDIDLVRNRNTFSNASSDTSAVSFDLDFTYGIKQKCKNAKLTYLTGLRYNTNHIDSLNESGSLATSTGSISFNNLYLKLGIVATWELTTPSASSSFISANAAYDVNLIDGDRTVESRFTSGGSSFKTASVDEDASSFNLGASYQYNLNEITYEFAWNYRFSSISSSNTLAVNIKHQF